MGILLSKYSSLLPPKYSVSSQAIREHRFLNCGGRRVDGCIETAAQELSTAPTVRSNSDRRISRRAVGVSLWNVIVEQNEIVTAIGEQNAVGACRRGALAFASACCRHLYVDQQGGNSHTIDHRLLAI